MAVRRPLRLAPASTPASPRQHVGPHQARKGLDVRGVLSIVLWLVASVGPAAPAAAQGQAPPRPPAPTVPGPMQTSPFSGGVPAGTMTAQPLNLSIGDAINRALDHNL